MLLRLSASEALVRAAFALASVGIAFTGHVALGHAHCDYTQLIAAALGLIFVTWRTRRTSHLMLGAMAAQVVVHGGVPTAVPMLGIHVVSAALALGLMHHSEQIWRAFSALLLPAPIVLVRVPAIAIAWICIPWRNSAMRVHIASTAFLRGPPAFA